MFRGGGTGEAREALASPEFRGFTTEKIFGILDIGKGKFSCFTGKMLVPPPLAKNNKIGAEKKLDICYVGVGWVGCFQANVRPF